jgi:predicted acyl esterase
MIQVKVSYLVEGELTGRSAPDPFRFCGPKSPSLLSTTNAIILALVVSFGLNDGPEVRAPAALDCAGGWSLMVDHSPGQRKPFPVPGVIFDYDVVVPMSDGLGLHVNVFRPQDGRPVPVIITHGVYGKDVHWAAAKPYQDAWKILNRKLPELPKRSTLAFMRWEMPDPERWVPQGYAVIHADARGSGKTSGQLDIMSPREIADYKELIEWAGAQSWSNGRVGLMGISYYAITQWRVAALKPKGLAAIMPWEGAFDHYRDIASHGGIPSSFFIRHWYRRQVFANAHSNTESTLKDAITGGPARGMNDIEDGPPAPPDLEAAFQAHPFDDEFHRSRTPDADAIEIPVLSVGNWGGAGLHLRGNIEGYLSVKSKQKWLRVDAGDHFSPFYREESLAMQGRFLDRFLNGARNGWDDEPHIKFVVRDPRGERNERKSDTWPLPDTRWTKLFLDGQSHALTGQPMPQSAVISYKSSSSGATFIFAARDADSELAGPVAAKLWVRPEGEDMDVFAVLRLLDPAGKDVTFEAANSPRYPVAHGWLRLSHRELDAAHSRPWRPYHAHDKPAPVEPNQDYQVEIELWPTSVVIPAGYRLALTILGRDFVFPGWRNAFASFAARVFGKLPLISALIMQGSAPFLHDGEERRRSRGIHRILCGGSYDSHILLPVVTDSPGKP